MPAEKQVLFNESFLRRLERLALQYHSAAKSQVQGERRSSQRGQSVEFADFRPYSLGDDFRRIDWNAYARLERLFVKLFLDEKEITVHLLLDNSGSMDWGEPNKFSYAVRTAAAFGYIALVGLDRVSASALFTTDRNNHQRLRPVRGRISAFRLFTYLQSIQTSETFSDPTNTPGFFSLMNEKPGTVLILSDLMGDSWQSAVNRISARGHEVSIIHVLAPDEANPLLSGDFCLVDSENAEQVEITADYETIQKYNKHLVEWQNTWAGFCAKRQINYVSVTSGLPLEELIFASLPKSGILR